MTELFYSGTSGLVLPVNKTEFPPEFQDKTRLQYYASLFNSIEMNCTFYKLPKSTTVLNWAESVPDDFRFTFKVPKSITHVPNLDFDAQILTDFLQVVDHVGPKKGCLLGQFPPSLAIDNIEPFKCLMDKFASANNSVSWNLAIEFRNPSWYDPQVGDLLKNFNATMVLHDMKNSATAWDQVDVDLVYLRFHGPEPRYRGNYSDKFLKQRATLIQQWLGEDKKVYAYFNNTLGGAYSNLRKLNKFVHS